MSVERSTAEPALHVVLGAGQVGPLLTELLLARGHRVRTVARSERARLGPGHEHLAGDVTDGAFAARAGAGASVVYDCMNPEYHRWPEALLPLARGALAVARASAGKLIALDSLYMYGRPTGPMSEDSPIAPCSKKGRLRVDLAELRMGADRRGEVRVALARASDFIGVDLPRSAFSDRFFERVFAGRPGECLGDPEMPHSYTYAPDVARALMILGSEERALGRIWHVPTAPAESTRAIGDRLGRALGRPVAVARIPKLALRAVGLVQPFVRELVEMVYQWEVPFVIDDRRFRATFGMEPTPLDDVTTKMAAWAGARFGGRAA